MMPDNAAWDHVVISLCNKTDGHKMLSSVLTSKYHIHISLVAFNNLCLSIRLHQAHNKNTNLHQHTDATLETDHSKTCLAVYCVVTSWLSSVCRSHRSLTWRRLTSRETKRACSEQNRYEVRWHVVSLTSQRFKNEPASPNWQTEKVRDKPYALDSRDVNVGAEAAGAWNWPHPNLGQKFTMHGNNKYLDLWSHTWRKA